MGESQEARGLPTGRPAKLNRTTRAGAAQRIKDGAIPEQIAAELGISRSTLHRELRKHRDTAAVSALLRETDQRRRPASDLTICLRLGLATRSLTAQPHHDDAKYRRRIHAIKQAMQVNSPQRSPTSRPGPGAGPTAVPGPRPGREAPRRHACQRGRRSPGRRYPRNRRDRIAAHFVLWSVTSSGQAPGDRADTGVSRSA
jgi:AraC-like DNA-binding protein